MAKDLKGIVKRVGAGLTLGLVLFGTIFSMVRTGQLQKALDERDEKIDSMGVSISTMVKENQDLNTLIEGLTEKTQEQASAIGELQETIEDIKNLTPEEFRQKQEAVEKLTPIIENLKDKLKNNKCIVYGGAVGFNFNNNSAFQAFPDSPLFIENGVLVSGDLYGSTVESLFEGYSVESHLSYFDGMLREVSYYDEAQDAFYFNPDSVYGQYDYIKFDENSFARYNDGSAEIVKVVTPEEYNESVIQAKDFIESEIGIEQ